MSSDSVEDYLKAIFALAADDTPAATSAIAVRLGLAAGSVTGMLKRLSERGLVDHVPYHGARLTAAGRSEAIRLVRRHRLIELFLVRVLGFPWDRVHAEAERLEHAVTDELVDRMSELLGNPGFDPHGAPIPETGQPFHEPVLPTLSDVSVGGCAVLRQVSDRDPEVLRYLKRLKMLPGAVLTVLERAPLRGPLRIEVDGSEQYIGAELSALIRVEPVPDGARAGGVATNLTMGKTNV